MTTATIDKLYMTTTAASTPLSTHSKRLYSIDALRGLVIILMALDHVRDFFGPAGYSPEDLNQTSIGLFLTRWITHFCAPVFVLLAGTSAYLYWQKVQDKNLLSRFLITRGFWLVLVELLIINPSWQFSTPTFLFVQVIWALGWSMIVLGLMVHLPYVIMATFGLITVLGHNLLDGMSASQFDSLSWLFNVLHEPGYIRLLSNGFGVYITYPLLPWIGLIILGFMLGPVFTLPTQQRFKMLMTVGVCVIGLFILLRLTNIYGDPNAWIPQSRGDAFTVLSFLNTTKYPGSLLFLCMTLGPALILLAFLDKVAERQLKPLVVFGAVPMMFYLIHVPLVNVASHLWQYLEYGEVGNMFFGRNAWPTGYEFSLGRVYLAWIGLVALLYFPCLWFGRLKRKHRHWSLSYL